MGFNDFKIKLLADYKFILIQIFKPFNVDVKGNLQVLEILFLLVPGNQYINTCLLINITCILIFFKYYSRVLTPLIFKCSKHCTNG